MVAPKKKAVRQPKSGLTPTDIEMIAQIAAQAATEAVKVALAEEKQSLLDADPDYIPTEAEILTWSDEKIAEYNKVEQAKLAKRKATQAANLRRLGDMSAAERKAERNVERDPSIIRLAVPTDWDGNKDDLVRVICKRRIGLGDGLMSDLGEEVDMYRVSAQKLQASGVIEVSI